MTPTGTRLALPFILALKDCDDELRGVASELLVQLAGGELDAHEEASTLNLLAEMLSPHANHTYMMAVEASPDAARITADMLRQEATFADRLQATMTARGITQAELAEKIGVGQPAVSMMLNRTCRPQKKTVHKIATALGVTPADLGPG